MMVHVVAGVWAGVVVGVSFLATPVKFRARSLTYDAALDVGRVTFRAMAWVERLLWAALLLAGVLGSSLVFTWWWGLSCGLLGLLTLQQAWLIRVMDARAAAVIETRTRPPPSHLHHVYVATEVAKVGALLALAAA